ncbi:Rhomboid protein 1, mitochondrial [Auxenochlorella protothecoides]|nr:Rhomboid protein 1, mitochondrial [Auxenochlorella protothecoides]KFM22639.1 Rhomboid protein 1, mitochondrial [Auxenochlorella protothecoides]RMZ57533.1 hypothetical protein APUTEX25_001733 [Auxenochlorella protothecoides]|eukprot:RMZ57533.1 hypothetical protein APUTEX25_001733 [Auxenochlorella protothecoides]
MYGLLAANVGGWVLWRTNPAFMSKNAMVSIPHLKRGRVWTLLTHSFSHRDTWHLASNGLGLYGFGLTLGRLFGGRKLAMIYAGCALGGGLGHCLSQAAGPLWARRDAWGRLPLGTGQVPALGASGVVAGMLAMTVYLAPSQKVLLYGIIPLPMYAFGLLWAGLDLLTLRNPGSNVSVGGHAGGALAGLAFLLAYRRGRFPMRWGW